MQAEIDAIYETSAERYHFSRAGHIGPEQFRALQMMQEQFARNISHTVGAWLRAQFLATAQAVEQKSYSSFLSHISDKSFTGSLRLEPVGTHGVVVLDLELVPPMVDLLLGGSGRGGVVRDLTEIEEAIVGSVVGVILREWNKTWEPSDTQLSLEKREREGQIQRLIPLHDKVVCLPLEIVMAEATGTMTLCLPAVAMSSILRRLISQRDRPPRRSEEWKARIETLMLTSTFQATLRLPSVKLSATEVASLYVDQVLTLPIPRTTGCELHVGDVRLMHAMPVRSGEHRGAKITSTIAVTPMLVPTQIEDSESWTR